MNIAQIVNSYYNKCTLHTLSCYRLGAQFLNKRAFGLRLTLAFIIKERNIPVTH